MANDFASFFLGEEPRAAYFNAIQPFGKSPARRRFFESQFNPVYNRYFGALGQQAAQGQTPTLSFQDFLQNKTNFNNMFYQQPQQMRGYGNANPRTRWLLGF